MKPKLLWAYLISISLVAVVLVNSINPTYGSIDQKLSQWLGSIFGILLIPGVYYIFKRNNLDDTGGLPRAFIIIIIAMTLIISVANVFMASQGNSSSRNLTLWSDGSCDFEVTFPTRPNDTSSQLQSGSGEYTGSLKGAEVIFEGAFYRCECISVPQEIIKNINEGSIQESMKQIAERLGLSLRVYEYQQLEGYLVATITGTKLVDGKESLVEIKNFVGNTSVLTLYLMTSPERFKSKVMQAFTESPTIKINVNKN